MAGSIGVAQKGHAELAAARQACATTDKAKCNPRRKARQRESSRKNTVTAFLPDERLRSAVEYVSSVLMGAWRRLRQINMTGVIGQWLEEREVPEDTE